MQVSLSSQFIYQLYLKKSYISYISLLISCATNFSTPFLIFLDTPKINYILELRKLEICCRLDVRKLKLNKRPHFVHTV
jgi:hypothetical protein